mgnify:CR=1 FL=1
MDDSRLTSELSEDNIEKAPCPRLRHWVWLDFWWVSTVLAVTGWSMIAKSQTFLVEFVHWTVLSIFFIGYLIVFVKSFQTRPDNLNIFRYYQCFRITAGILICVKTVTLLLLSSEARHVSESLFCGIALLSTIFIAISIKFFSNSFNHELAFELKGNEAF